ncbi:GtrA family protein [Chromatium okenii]|jgi:putative flippase GtrA|uniref:GtrA family protein n=1 Tax=Chromatium okenii TaxID=61644 RepID=A0A2S7XPK5_9GAMM|nr:GtrA family protein [Chromatium okenii]MBV5308785.1 GtrA family protein [Chromatium okenii]PQJ95493.1 GtrA family protein [Chromatium okenii]
MKWHVQLSRYALVGVASNAFGYFLYLSAIWLGAGPKTAMTWLYLLGILQTFFFNKDWSFQFGGAAAPALARYAALYALGYAINFLAIMLLVDYIKLPHQWVMAGLIFYMAIFFFLGQKFWVFNYLRTKD